jgi:hypothetical protein
MGRCRDSLVLLLLLCDISDRNVVMHPTRVEHRRKNQTNKRRENNEISFIMVLK